MDKTIRALGISLIIAQIINIIYLVMFFGNILNNSAQLNGRTIYYIGWSEIESFLGFEVIMLGISILLTILLVDREVVFIETLKRIIRIDEIEGR
jgi:hypothetical protein